MANTKLADAYATTKEFETAKLQKLIDLLDAFDADMAALIDEFPEAGANGELCKLVKNTKSGVPAQVGYQLNNLRAQYGLSVPAMTPAYPIPTVTPTA